MSNKIPVIILTGSLLASIYSGSRHKQDYINYKNMYQHSLKEIEATNIKLTEYENDKAKLIQEIKDKDDRLKKASRGSSISKRHSVPGHRNFKAYMDYRAITNRSSLQYKLQQGATTDKDGLRKLNGKYMIALGSYWGNVGDEVVVDLGDNTIECIIADQKADIHTDSNNMFHLSDGSVIEFIVDSRKLNKTIKQTGDCSYASHSNLERPVQNIMR